MLSNYLKIAFRNLAKNKVYSIINIGGLAVGMAVAMIIGLWIHDETSINKHFKNYKTLYQVRMNQSFDGRRTTQETLPYPLGEELKTNFPDFKGVVMCDFGKNHVFKYQDKKISRNGYTIGKDAIQMFSIKILKGGQDPLQDPTSIVLTDETAKILFGDEEPIGKIIKMNDDQNLKVTAVVPKQPFNSSLPFDFLIPWDLQEILNPEFVRHQKLKWGNNAYRSFVQLNETTLEENVNAKIKDVILNHVLDNPLMKTAIKPELFIHPMSKWKLYADFENGKNTGGFIRYVRMFGILGLIVLIIACINFMNLSTARSEKRAKEVGVRKAIGSERIQLIGQFLSESFLIAGLAFIVALAMVFLALPYFNALTQKAMSLQIANPLFWGILLAFTAFTGLLAGSYPSFYLSSFNPVSVLKGRFQFGKNGSLPRKILVVIQFASSVVLMICTVIIYQQIQHGKNRPIGYNKEGLISVNWSTDIAKNFNILRQELLNSGAVISICKANSDPTQIWSNNNGVEWKGSQPNDKTALFDIITTEFDYTQTFGINLVAGRDFSREFSSDSTAVLLNQAAVKRMGLENPIGETIYWNRANRTVVGIVPDMQMKSPYNPVSPAIIGFDKYWVSRLCVRINPEMSTSKAIQTMKPIFDKFNPVYPFEYKFADELYAQKFNYEELIGNLSAIIALLTIFISCLGLFGLATFVAEQKVKEIGIRKVLGASVAGLWQLLSTGFIFLVLIACAIAIPVAYFVMHKWLQNYNYKIEIGYNSFALVIVVALMITLLTVSFQAIKAARMNPVKAIKTE